MPDIVSNPVTVASLNKHNWNKISIRIRALVLWVGYLAFTQEIKGSTPTGSTCSNNFFQYNRPGYPHPVCSELGKSDIRVAVGDYSVTERQWWHPPYQTGKNVHVHTKHDTD